MFREQKLFKRLLSALILAPITLLVIHTGGVTYELAIILVGALMASEWAKMLSGASFKPNSISSSIGWLAFGFIYVFTPCTCLLFLRSLPEGETIIFWLVLSVWATDTGAYFFGITLKGPKIAPMISPKKTWAGLIGAIICSTAVGYLFSESLYDLKFNIIVVSAILALVAQIGDFFESAIKRYFRVKDSGNLIPGHGGILDRIDGLITASIFVTLLVVL